MLGIVPIISKIAIENGAYICYDKDDQLIFVTSSKEIAEMYFNVPIILTHQAEVIVDLRIKLEQAVNEHNNLILGMLPSGSNLIH